MTKLFGSRTGRILLGSACGLLVMSACGSDADKRRGRLDYPGSGGDGGEHGEVPQAGKAGRSAVPDLGGAAGAGSEATPAGASTAGGPATSGTGGLGVAGTGAGEATGGSDGSTAGTAGSGDAGQAGQAGQPSVGPVPGSVQVLDAHGSAFEATVGGGALYILQTSSIPISHYTLVRIPLDGDARQQVWDANGGIGDGGLYADDEALYWAVAGGSVFKKAKDAAPDVAPTSVFQPAGSVSFLTARDGTFYWSTGADGGPAYVYSRAMDAPQANLGTKLVTSNQGRVSGFAITSDAIYWVGHAAGDPHLWTTPLAGGLPTEVPGSLVVDNAPLFALGKTLYFVRGAGQDPANGIYRFTSGDSMATQLVQQDSVNALLVDETSLYYRATFFDVALRRAPLAGGVGTPFVPVANYGLLAGQDAEYLYAAFSWSGDGPALKFAK